MSRAAHRVVRSLLHRVLEGRVGHGRQSPTACVRRSTCGRIAGRRRTLGLRGWAVTDLAAPRCAPSAARRRRRRGRRLRRRSSSATGSRCAGSPCRCCRRAAAPCGSSRCRDLHLTPGQHREDRVGALAWPRSRPTSSSTPATTSRHVDAVPRAAARDGAAARASPACSSSGPTTTSRRCRRTRPATSPRSHAERRSARADLPVDDLRRGPARRRLGRPRQRRGRRCRWAATTSSSSGSTTPTSATTATPRCRPRAATGRRADAWG